MILDHVALADTRIVSEYRDKPKFNKWVKTNAVVANVNFESALDTITKSYNPDTAADELLNIIGRIVGQPRPIVKITDYKVFGYEGNTSYVNYNVAPYIGDGASQDVPLSNDLYRILVKAKIARNISDATYDSIVSLVEFILGFEVTALIDYGDMSFQLGFEREPDLNTQFLLDNFEIIPRPQGVNIRPYFILPKDIAAIEAASDHVFQYGNYTLPGDVS